MTAVKTAGRDTVLDEDFSWQHGIYILQDYDMPHSLQRHSQLMLVCLVRDSVPSTPFVVNDKWRRAGSGIGKGLEESKDWTSTASQRICEFCYLESKIFPEKSSLAQFA